MTPCMSFGGAIVCSRLFPLTTEEQIEDRIWDAKRWRERRPTRRALRRHLQRLVQLQRKNLRCAGDGHGL